MERELLDDVLDWFRLPEGWKFRVKNPVKWKDYKRYYKDKTLKDYKEYAIASTDVVEKTIYIHPFYIKYLTPMTLISTIFHELGHVHQTDKKGGDHGPNWLSHAEDCFLTLEDEYIAKNAMSSRIYDPKGFNKRMKAFLRSQKVKYGYYLPKRYR